MHSVFGGEPIENRPHETWRRWKDNIITGLREDRLGGWEMDDGTGSRACSMAGFVLAMSSLPVLLPQCYLVETNEVSEQFK
jgi:hypothetical protein